MLGLFVGKGKTSPTRPSTLQTVRELPFFMVNMCSTQCFQNLNLCNPTWRNTAHNHRTKNTPIPTTTLEQSLTGNMDANPNFDLDTSIPNLVVDVILRTLQDMQQQIDCLKNNNQNSNDHIESQPPSHDPTHHSSHPNHVQPATIHHPGHPFNEFIMSKPIPSSYRPLVHSKVYDGTTNSQIHIDAFKNAMLISGDLDAMRCKSFPVTLSEAT